MSARESLVLTACVINASRWYRGVLRSFKDRDTEAIELSQYQLARSIGVPARRINEIVHGQRRISADTALRLARFFGTSERFWLNLQSRYDLEIEKDRLGPVLDGIQPLTAAS